MYGFKKTMIALALAGLAANATAKPFHVDLTGATNITNYGDLNQVTNSFDYAGIQYQSLTHVVGGSVTTTGGLNYGDTTITNLNLSNYASNRISDFTPGIDTELFQNTEANVLATGSWGLSFAMLLQGHVINPTGPVLQYDSGLIEMYLMRDNGTGSLEAVNIFDLTVTGSNPSNQDNFVVNGYISYSGNETTETALLNAFHLDGLGANDCLGDDSFKGLANCTAASIEVSFRVDQNLGTPTINASNPNDIILTGNHGGQLRFNANVPEPTTVLLLGGGLLGLGFSSRRRTRKTSA